MKKHLSVAAFALAVLSLRGFAGQDAAIDPSGADAPKVVVDAAKEKARAQANPPAAAVGASNEKTDWMKALDLCSRASCESVALNALPAGVQKTLLGSHEVKAYRADYHGAPVFIATGAKDGKTVVLAVDPSGKLLAARQKSAPAASAAIQAVGWRRHDPCCQAGPLTCNASGRQIWCYGFGRTCSCSYETVNGIVSCMDDDGDVRGDRCP